MQEREKNVYGLLLSFDKAQFRGPHAGDLEECWQQREFTMLSSKFRLRRANLRVPTRG